MPKEGNSQNKLSTRGSSKPILRRKVRQQDPRYNLRSGVDVSKDESNRSPRRQDTERKTVSASQQKSRKQNPNQTKVNQTKNTHPQAQHSKVPTKPNKKKSKGRPVTVSIRSRARSSSPSPSRIQPPKTSDIAQELKQRIKSILIKDRRVPKSNDIGILGFELKTRLALTSPVLTESGRRGGRVKITSRRVKKRYIPLWDINKQQDPTLICKVKVQIPVKKN